MQGFQSEGGKMKNIYRVTRPAWAGMDRAETSIIFAASVLLGIYGGVGQNIANVLPVHFRGFWPIIDVAVLTGGCLLLIRSYKRLRVGCYPSTFIYCFAMPEASNPDGKSHVIGYCNIRPDMENGEVIAEGASYFWENGQLDFDSVVGFRSTLVRGTKQEDGNTTCHIQFNINSGDSAKRFYRHGLLQFQLVPNTAFDTDKDTYAGSLRSTHSREVELQEMEVRARGYAELHSKGPVKRNEIETELSQSGDILLARLKALAKLKPRPPLWTDEPRPINKINSWGHHIPTPQSVILDEEMVPYIDRVLQKILALNGLKNEEIDKFKKVAREKAKTISLLGEYERELKIALLSRVRRAKQDAALFERAKIIYGQIKPFLVGDTLLDIGCGNGIIGKLATPHFKKVQLLDVVKYVPDALELPYLEYKEGHPLPVQEKYDTVLLLTVLHHSSDPVELLKMAWEVTNKTLIIIESVVGVHQVAPNIQYELADLSDKHQIAYAAFIDWFYNRVLHDNVPVPYNFTTPDNWQVTFRKHNMRLTHTVHEGQDIEIGPEYHILFVLEKQESETELALSSIARNTENTSEYRGIQSTRSHRAFRTRRN